MAKKKTRFFFSVKTQFENLGDSLINKELILACSNHGETLVDVSRCPKYFIDCMNINESAVGWLDGFPIMVWEMLKARLRGEQAILVLNPGGLGNSRTLRQNIVAFNYNILILGFRALGIKIVQVGISFENVSGLSKIIYSQRFSLLNKIFVRDKGSLERIRKAGGGHASIYPDLAFYRFLDEPIEPKGSAVGFSFRTDLGYASRKPLISEFIQLVIDKYPGKKFIFFSQVRRDEDYMLQLFQEFSDKGFDCEYIASYSDMEKIEAGYRNCSVLFSNRLHVLLLSASVGALPIPCIVDGESRKINCLFSDLGLTDNIVYMNQLRVELGAVNYSNTMKKFNECAKLINKMVPDLYDFR